METWLFFIFLLAALGSFRQTFLTTADSFASTAQLEQIVNLEKKLGDSLEEIIELERKQLTKIKKFAESVREGVNLVKSDGIKALENPIASYALIKRFANGWRELRDFFSYDYWQGTYLSMITLI